MSATEHIEDEIERTRGEMASTLNAIERKLSPKQIMDQAVDTMRELASDQSRVAQVVRDNPIPLALIGLGIGWLAVSGSMGRRASASEGSYESMEGLAPAWGSGAEDQAYGSAGSAEYVAGGEGHDIRDRASQLAGSARESMSRAADSTRGKVSQWSRQARSSANQAAGRTRDAYQDHPLTMGVVAALVGAAVGAILPRSRAESETLGQAAGDVLRQARQAGSELVDKAGRVIERTAQAAKDEAERAYRQEGIPGTTSSMTH
ncbi:MAG: DUF3618 domain-containing protein [Rhodospirillaceae bacterium]|nr:DUF3618 domain-containing protein [Rhodospirillales bacterium]